MKEPPSSRLRRKPSTVTNTAIAATISRKLKLVCSFNGAFHLRPPSNKLRYIGGETRIISVDRNIGFSKLRSRVSDLCPKLRCFSLKYQLPIPGSGSGFGRVHDTEMDSDNDFPLVSISSDEDLRCMIEEYEKLELYGKRARLWVFVCSDSDDTNNFRNGIVNDNGDLLGNYLVCDDKLNKNPVKNIGVGSLKSGDDSLRKMVLRQQLLIKKSDGFYSKQIDYHSQRNLVCEPRADLHQGNMADGRIESGHLQESGCRVTLDQSRLPPLNPRDGNLDVEKQFLSGKNCHGTGICAYDPKQDFGITGRLSPCNLNRENIMPRVMCCYCNSQWDDIGSAYPLRSPSAGERVWSGNQNGGRSHRLALNDARNSRVYPYQIRNSRSDLAEMGNNRIVRLEGRLKPNSHISNHGQPTTLHCLNTHKPCFIENIMEGGICSGGSLFGNSKSKDCQLACNGAAVESPLSSAMEAMVSQPDVLTGSPYGNPEVPCQSVRENCHLVPIDNKQFTLEQQEVNSIPGLSNDPYSSNGQAVEGNNKCMDTGGACSSVRHPKNETCYSESGVASSVDLLDNLSLSTTKGVEPPAPSSLASSGATNSLLKPGSEPFGLVDGEQVPEADKAVAIIPSAPSAVSMEKDQAHEEEIQQDLPSGLSINEKDETKQSIKCSKVIGGISSDLVAFYTHLAAGELQTIKNIDLEYIKELGSGTYGTVYHGKWRGSDVAIKKIKPSCFTEGSVEGDRLVADFWKEAHMLGQLHHPNIVAFYGVVTDGPANNLATVTEYMVNGSLKQVLRRKDRTIDRRKRIILAMDAAFGMEYLHEKNIVHFDLKSHNFLVNMRDPHRPVCKIGDLGLSKIKQRTLVSGGVRGTIPWMAPELLNSKNNMVTEKVDVYSFGIVMWELLTGEEPYSNLRSEEIIAGLIKGTLRPEIPSWCDPAWRSLMERCWSSDPESRPSFADIAKELRIMSAAMNIK